MLDGVDPGQDRGLDARGAVGVGGDLHAGGVGLINDGLDLIEGQLLGAGGVAVAEHTAGGADLDDLGAVFVQLADHLAALVGAVDHRRPLLVHRGREEGGVTMAAGRADGVGRRNDARPLDIAGVDRLLQADVVVVVGADIADGGEAGLQGAPGGAHRDIGAVIAVEGHGLDDRIAAVELAGDVVVGVDQAGQDGGVGQVDDLGPGRRDEARLDAGDAVVMDQDRDLGAGRLADPVDQVAGMDDHILGKGRRAQAGGGEDDGERRLGLEARHIGTPH
ncbi:hypothetical protein GALL_551410 [mine drainage metagenome]|uniref:Uncharacterized protein n=1 Tax=mine drainage metagenome TaxID=410659 RepID=A0A1J5NX36_9ZZZZ